MASISVLLLALLAIGDVCNAEVEKRIIGGNYAPPGKYPWAVHIRGDMKVNFGACGASFIADRWLVTAAHCVLTFDSDTNTTIDLTDPKVWHITAGQLFVNATADFLKEYRSEATEAPKVSTLPTPKANKTVQFSACWQVKQKLKLATDKSESCWTNLFETMIKNKDYLEKIEQLTRNCKRLDKEESKAARALEECNEKLDNVLMDSEETFDISKRQVASEQAWIDSHFHVDRVFAHPEYRTDDPLVSNDIALLRLDRPVPFNKLKGVAKISLPTEKNFPKVGKTCVLVGWGCLKEGEGGHPQAKFAEFKVLNIPECKKATEEVEIGYNPRYEFCAGFVKGVGVCRGDSGGGLACPTGPNTWTVAGVVSTGHPTKPEDYPGVFTRVAKYVDWIHATMAKHA